jgi:8-oxo-dGTP pyrophosphatase MutT (NUDIX family)
MRIRKTARVLLFDPAGRLLLVRMHDPEVAEENGEVVAEAYWVTVGGEIDPGEDITTAALREIREETGFSDVRLGPVVWYAEQVLHVRGEARLFQEHYVIAHTDETDWNTAGWTADEHRVIQHLKWWEMDALFQSGEIFFPSSLKENLLPLTDGILPPATLTIEP